jgi:hypothetical protein
MEEARQRMEEKVGLDAASIAFKAGELLAQLLRDEVEKASPLVPEEEIKDETQGSSAAKQEQCGSTVHPTAASSTKERKYGQFAKKTHPKLCQECKGELEYLTALKKHLVCKSCGNQQRNYTKRPDLK